MIHPLLTRMKHLWPALLALCLGLSILAHADVTKTPGEKPKDSTKDFRKDKDKNGYATPEARNGTTNFVSGMSVDVILDVDTSYLGLVKFSLRDLPQHGKLSEIRPHPTAMNKAIVTYIHDAASGQLIDRFSFVARLSGGSSSAPGVVSLIGKRADPIIEVVKHPLFRRVEPGNIDKGILVLRNKGFATYTQDMTWPPPWQGPPRLEVNVGEEREFLITVKPPAAGAYTFEKELQTGIPSSRIKCYVECVQAFVVSPSSIELKFDPATGTRSGSVQVSNASDTPLKLAVQSSDRLLAVKDILLEPKKSMDLSIRLDADDVAAFRGELWLVQEPYREKILISALAEPAQIQLLAPIGANTDLGIINKGSEAKVILSIANIGGTNAELSLLVPPPYTLLDDRADLRVEPRQTKNFTLAFKPEQPGKYDTLITIDGNAGKIPLSLKASMVDPARPAKAAPVANPKNADPYRPIILGGAPNKSAPTAAKPGTTGPTTLQINAPSAPVATPTTSTSATPPAPAVPGDDGALKTTVSPSKFGTANAAFFNYMANYGIGAEILPELRSKTLQRVEQIGVVDATTDTIVVGWMPPEVKPKSYSLQTSGRVRNEATGMTMKSWKNIDKWEPVEMPNGAVAARVSNLAPQTPYEFRVLGIDDEGKLSRASDILTVTTAAPYSVPSWLWTLLITIIGAIIIVILRRVQAGHWQRV